MLSRRALVYIFSASPVSFTEFIGSPSVAFSLSLTVDVPVIASGGAGKISDFTELFKALPKVDAGLAASIFHFGEVKISDLKDELAKNDIFIETGLDNCGC